MMAGESTRPVERLTEATLRCKRYKPVEYIIYILIYVFYIYMYSYIYIYIYTYIYNRGRR